jgi:hypothetical protein
MPAFFLPDADGDPDGSRNTRCAAGLHTNEHDELAI